MKLSKSHSSNSSRKPAGVSTMAIWPELHCNPPKNTKREAMSRCQMYLPFLPFWDALRWCVFQVLQKYRDLGIAGLKVSTKTVSLSPRPSFIYCGYILTLVKLLNIKGRTNTSTPRQCLRHLNDSLRCVRNLGDRLVASMIGSPSTQPKSYYRLCLSC